MTGLTNPTVVRVYLSIYTPTLPRQEVLLFVYSPVNNSAVKSASISCLILTREFTIELGALFRRSKVPVVYLEIAQSKDRGGLKEVLEGIIW